MTLQGTRCTLRDWQPHEAEILAYYAGNVKIFSNLRDSYPHPYTLDHADFWIGFAPNDFPNFHWAIEVESEPCGNISLFRKNDIHYYNAEIGYWIAEKHWGKGYITEAIALVCEFAFLQTDLVRIYAEVFDYNIASARALQKNGFSWEGHFKKSVFKNGIFHDSHIYGKYRLSSY